MPSEVKLVILIATQVGRGQAQVDAFEKLAPLVRNEEGCLQYDLHRVAGNDDQFVLIERWTSKSALEAHDVTSHMIAAAAHNPTFRAGPATVLHLGPTIPV
ncbi:antibiotic biosynthesis monooxygenase [Pseudomonas gingeri]|uniref:Antibiotic biosynthesis monooxygenase n=1 Tax=Pseudomonas gingeri TaxID=117681 RepID=A0A7Y7XHY1_9PSED|nr:putative quinol monooxygenase [Pseudomonas gingeri]NWB99102.1 antibiotic biosynthesis monooxygenase [Pseudomonas gingeri]